MKAAIRRKYCAPEGLTIEEVEQPTVKDDEVLIRVYATTVNRTDCAIVTGKPFVMRFFVGLLKPKTPVPGTDFAGKVEAVGKNVKKYKVNDRVFGFHDEGLNSQAEYMTFSEDAALSKIPENISYHQAAASLEGAHYAYNFMNKVEIKAGKKVLINGVTGAIGSALLQFLKSQNVYVTAVCNTKNIDLIKSFGPDKIYDYMKEDFTKDDEIYDFICDAVGKSTFAKCKPLLKKGGVYVSSELGPNAQNPFLAMWTPLFDSKKVIFPIPSNIKRSITFIKDLLEKGQFQPVIDRIYPLEDIAKAYEYVLTGEKTGNVILSME